MDYGDNPSFKITRMTGMATWRTGTGNFILYGTNDISNVGGNDGGTDAGSLNTTCLTQIFNVSNQQLIGIVAYKLVIIIDIMFIE